MHASEQVLGVGGRRGVFVGVGKKNEAGGGWEEMGREMKMGTGK
jgi:hypothetical protein